MQSHSGHAAWRARAGGRMAWLAVLVLCASESSIASDLGPRVLDSPLAAVSPTQIVQADAAELSFWESVKDSDNPAELRAYLEAYPTGHFAALARIRLDKLTGTTEPASSEPEPDAAGEDSAKASSEGPPVNDCDRLAASPYAAWQVEGVPYAEIESGPAIEACRMAVESHPGTPRFEHQLGRALDVAREFEEAAEWYRKAAEAGMAAAQNNLGDLYYQGDGLEQDMTEAMKWYREAAGQDYARSQRSLGLMYLYGDGVEEDAAEAKRWFREAAKAIREIAERDNAAAQYDLGVMYQHGHGVGRSDEEARRWFLKAAEQDHVWANYELGRIYAEGRGVVQDDDTATQWFRKAAEQGDDLAQYKLAIAYAKGRGVPQDHGEAARWFRKAAERGYAPAQNSLGVRYERGQGVAKDSAEAARWYRYAAEQGHASAQANLGALYAKGLGVAQDGGEAVHWFRKAAEQGHARAKYNLGVSYERGSGVAKDEASAIVWYKMAALQDYGTAQKRLERLGVSVDRVSSTEIKAVQKTLADLGYDAGPADGALGPRTTTAIEAYQRDRGLTADGDLTLELTGRILGLETAQQAPAASGRESGTVSQSVADETDLDDF